MSTTTETTDAATAEQFVFEATLRTTDGTNWAIEVPFNGTASDLREAASRVTVNTETVREPEGDQPRVIRITGSSSAVLQALQEYSRRAVSEGSYTLGDMFSNNYSY